MTGPKRILAAIDFSPASRAALRCAVLLAERSGASLAILHVLELPSSAEHMSLARTMIHQLLELTGADAARRASVLVTPGDPVRELCRHASDCDLVLMGKYGERNGPPVGSVTARVMQAAPCLVVPVWSPTGVGAPTDQLEHRPVEEP